MRCLQGFENLRRSLRRRSRVDKYEMTCVVVTEKEFEESDERGKNVVAVKGGLVVKVMVPSMKFKD